MIIIINRCKTRWQHIFRISLVSPLSFKGGNRSHLDDHDWLGKSGNRVLFELTESPFEEAEEEAAPPILPLASE